MASLDFLERGRLPLPTQAPPFLSYGWHRVEDRREFPLTQEQAVRSRICRACHKPTFNMTGTCTSCKVTREYHEIEQNRQMDRLVRGGWLQDANRRILGRKYS